MAVKRKVYKTRHLLWDLFLTLITHGLWLIWIIIRTLRAHQ
jgi:hypothetical protein